MGATYGINSDCYPYTIVEVKSPKTIVVQADLATATADSEYFGEQKHTFERNPYSMKQVYTLRKNGKWQRKGQPMNNYSGLSVGNRRYYQDPHF